MDLQITELRNQLASVQETNGVQLRIRELETQKQELHRDRLQTLMSGATIRAPYDGIVDRVAGQDR